MFLNVFILLMSFGFSVEFTVDVKQGPLRGDVLYVGKHAVFSFKNIPYAKQPVGNLRFQLPKEQDGVFTEEHLKDNITVRCPQHSVYEGEVLTDIPLGQEDCLYLDVYVRKDHESENSSLPTVVYFHGGHFQRGSKEDYGPDYLLRFSDVILVVPNYRLGILGFLSFQDSLLPGNLGLWDQNAALKWVFENIVHFGGDPQRVTIAGHEAGATSVGLHILASASHDYFQGALSGSGTALSNWLVDTEPSLATAHTVADILRCPTVSMDKILICLKTASIEDILKVQGKLKDVAFLPTVDSSADVSLIPYPPKILYQRGCHKNVNYLFGYTANEASYEVAREFPNVLKYQHLDKMIHHFLQPYFKNALNFDMIVKAAKYHYLRGIMIPTFESIEPQIARLMTDFLYKSPVEQLIKLHQQKTGNIFVYVFKETGKVCGLENRRCFGNEYYVFNTTFHENMWDLIDPDIERTIETISKIWGNFIRFGHPDAYTRWEPIHDISEMHYAAISDIIERKTNYGTEDGEFWIHLVSELNAARNESEESLQSSQQGPEYSTIGTYGVAGLAILCGVLCVALIGLVVTTKRRTLTVSIVSSSKDIRMNGS